jgi:hypothetical protein
LAIYHQIVLLVVAIPKHYQGDGAVFASSPLGFLSKALPLFNEIYKL